MVEVEVLAVLAVAEAVAVVVEVWWCWWWWRWWWCWEEGAEEDEEKEEEEAGGVGEEQEKQQQQSSFDMLILRLAMTRVMMVVSMIMVWRLVGWSCCTIISTGRAIVSRGCACNPHVL